MEKIWIILFVLLLISISNVSGVIIGKGVIINTSESNASLTFGTVINSTSIDINESEVDLVSISCEGGSATISDLFWALFNTNKDSNSYCVLTVKLGNTFVLGFQMLAGGIGAVISLLLILGTFYMLWSGSMGYSTFIKCLIIEVVMFLIAGTIVILAI